ncbi:MAG: disulfide bond formation protein B [Pseudomonadota bacterium]
MEPFKVAKAIKILNAIDALGLGFLLLIAFVLQIDLHELPCPLCLLQRIGILGIAFGFLLNVQFKIQPGHYTLSLLAALLTASISIRQIFLHVMPGDPGYGSALLGLHLYTWVFLLCVAVIIYIAIIFSISPQYSDIRITRLKGKSLQVLTHLAFAVVFLLTVFNGISTYLECGLKACPENPVKYEIQLIEPHAMHS